MASKRTLERHSPPTTPKRTKREIEISDIESCVKDVTVHGRVTELTEVKDSRSGNTKFFRGRLANDEKDVPIISYEPKLWPPLQKSKVDGTSVALVDCCIRENNWSQEKSNFEIFVSGRTKITNSPRKFDVQVVSSGARAVCVDEITQLSEGSNVDVTAKVLSLESPELIKPRFRKTTLTKQNCVVGDATGRCRLVLWEDQVGAVKPGECYSLKAVSVKKFDGQKYLSANSGSSVESCADIGVVSEDLIEYEDMQGM